MPKDTTSTKESSSFPNSLGIGFLRATWPSKPSKITDTNIAQEANVKWLSREKIIDIKPHKRLKFVSRLAKKFTPHLLPI